jgi:HEAT repeat protein
MRIYFCDGCNESIPLADIQAGQVTTIKGKLFCRGCIPPGAGGASQHAEPAARRGTHPLIVLLLVGLLAWTVWHDVPWFGGPAVTEGSEPGVRAASGERQRLDILEQSLDRMAGERDQLERRLTFQRGDIDTVRNMAADISRTLDQMGDSIDGLVRGQAETGQFIEKLNFQENRTQALAARIDTLADMLAAQEQKLAMGLAAVVPGTTANVTGVAGGGGAPAPDPKLLAELDEIRRALLDADASIRFDAVDRIGKGRYKQLAPELLPVVHDEDTFVRMLAMQVLGDFGHVEAVQPLFDVIEDPASTIRKVAAETLVRLTGYDPGYDPRGSKAERDKAVKRWKEWVGSRVIKN